MVSRLFHFSLEASGAPLAAAGYNLFLRPGSDVEHDPVPARAILSAHPTPSALPIISPESFSLLKCTGQSGGVRGPPCRGGPSDRGGRQPCGTRQSGAARPGGGASPRPMSSLRAGHDSLLTPRLQTKPPPCPVSVRDSIAKASVERIQSNGASGPVNSESHFRVWVENVVSEMRHTYIVGKRQVYS